jgi:putative tryptophan/tyrosine transport system substrate-binding protein
MRRREFITLLVGAAAWPLPLSAQQPERMHGVGVATEARAVRIAVLGPDEEPRFSEVVSGLTRGLQDNGYSVGLEIIEQKVRRRDPSSARAAMEQIVARRTRVLFVIGSELARVARQASSDLPIVFITPGDPVASGLVASLAHPGGNMTAVTFEYPELSAKRLELLKAVNPKIRRVLVVYDPSDASPQQGMTAAREAAPKLGMALVEHEARGANDVTRASAVLDEVDAVMAIPGGLTSAHYQDIIRAAHSKLRPTFFHDRTATTTEALASYGANERDVARGAARLVAKILNGEKAGDLPIERPTRLKLTINLKTAKALGLDVPPSLLARADEVIE